MSAPTPPQSVLEGHTGKRVRWSFKGESWDGWLVSLAPGTPGTSGMVVTVKRDDGEDWVVLAHNVEPIDAPAASAPQGDTADVIKRARCVLAESYDGIDPDVETRHDGAVANLAAAGLLASPVPEVVIERARHIIADHCFGPHATPAAEERALDIASACTDDMADQGLLAVAASPAAPVMQPTHIQAADELDRGAAQLADVADITQSRSAYGYGYRIAYERIVDWLRHEFEPSAPAPADDEAAQVERMAVAIAKDDGFDWRSGEWNGVYLSRARAALAALKEGHRA